MSLIPRGRPWHAIVLFLAAPVFATADSIVVAPTVTAIAGGYEYAYTITNDTPDDPFLIDIPVPDSPDAISDLTAPAGFKAAFDPGLGLISFLENSNEFTSTPQSGFFFDSPDAPGAVSFQATVLSSTTSHLYTLSGPTLAPVPEPAHLSLVFSALALVFFALASLAPVCRAFVFRNRRFGLRGQLAASSPKRISF